MGRSAIHSRLLALITHSLAAVITSQVTFPSEDGRTSLQDSTLSTQRCKALRKEHDRIVKLRTALKRPAASATCYPARGEASEWDAKDLPTCQIDCLAPLVCLSSETCKCTRDRCGDPRANGPFPAVAYTPRKSFAQDHKDPPPAPVSLAQRVKSIPWESLILPGARRAFATPLGDLPRANVVDLPDSIDTHLQSPACYDLDKSPLPFLGDHFVVEALRNRSIAIEDADFVVVPYFQVRPPCSVLLETQSSHFRPRTGVLLQLPPGEHVQEARRHDRVRRDAHRGR